MMIEAFERRVAMNVHRQEMKYIDEEFGNMPSEQLNFIKRYVAEA